MAGTRRGHAPGNPVNGHCDLGHGTIRSAHAPGAPAIWRFGSTWLAGWLPGEPYPRFARETAQRAASRTPSQGHGRLGMVAPRFPLFRPARARIADLEQPDLAPNDLPEVAGVPVAGLKFPNQFQLVFRVL